MSISALPRDDKLVVTCVKKAGSDEVIAADNQLAEDEESP